MSVEAVGRVTVAGLPLLSVVALPTPVEVGAKPAGTVVLSTTT